MKSYVMVVFAGLAVIGIVGINSIPSISKDTFQTTSDGITIFYNLYQPEGLTQKTPVVIMGHGIMVNKEMMTNFAMELVMQGYIVANVDWRGHGKSTGSLSIEGLYTDLEAVVADIPAHAPADMSTIALLGYSMGGSPTYKYAADHSTVKAWVGVGAAAAEEFSSKTTPENVLMVIAKYDEAFPPESAKQPMVALTGVPLEAVEFEKLYGSINDGTARKIHVVPGADHLTTPWNSDFILSATYWIAETFEGSPPEIHTVFHQRVLLFFVGLTGFVGFLFMFSSLLAGKLGVTPDKKSFAPEISVKSFVSTYYLVTLLLFFSMAVFLPLFLTPLPFSAFLTTLTGGLGINLLVYCRRLAKKEGRSIKPILKENFSRNPKIWIFSSAVTVVFMICYYFLVGLHFLGTVPSVTRAPYLVVYSVVLFFSFWVYALFIQKVSIPFWHKTIRTKNETIKYVLASLITFLLIYSWFTIIVLIPCIVMNNFFIAMILILMVPIFLFMSFFSVYMEKVTGSTIPSAVLHAVWIGCVVTTMTPYISLV